MGSMVIGPAFMREIKLFEGFPDADLAQLLTLGKIQNYEAHSNLVIEGEPTGGLMIIIQGLVSILKRNRNTGDLLDLGQIRAGGFFGEMSMIDRNPRSATVRALVTTSVIAITREDFLAWLQNNTALTIKFQENCLRELVTRLRDLDDHYIQSQYQLWKSAIRKDGAA